MGSWLAPLLAAQILAAPVVAEIHYMPPGHKVWIQPPVNAWGRGFDLEGYKLLLKLDSDLWEANKQLEDFDSIVGHYKDVIVEMDRIVAGLKEDRVIFGARAERLGTSLKTCEDDLVEAAGGPVWPYIVAAGGALFGVVGMTYGLARR